MRDDDFIFGLSSDHGRIVFILAEAIRGIFRRHLELRISWQAQYLLMLDGNQCCSAHCK